MTNPTDNEPDETGHLLRGALPRWPAPARLRRAVMEALNPVEARSRPSLWLPPALAALAAAMVMVLWLAPALRRETGDQIEYLSRAAISEHARAVLWSDTRADLLPAALPRVMEESGVTLNWVFTGDDDLQLIGAVPTVVEGRRGMSLVYRDRDGHTVVYRGRSCLSRSAAACRSSAGARSSGRRAMASASSCGGRQGWSA